MDSKDSKLPKTCDERLVVFLSLDVTGSMRNPIHGCIEAIKILFALMRFISSKILIIVVAYGDYETGLRDINSVTRVVSIETLADLDRVFRFFDKSECGYGDDIVEAGSTALQVVRNNLGQYTNSRILSIMVTDACSRASSPAYRCTQCTSKQVQNELEIKALKGQMLEAQIAALTQCGVTCALVQKEQHPQAALFPVGKFGTGALTQGFVCQSLLDVVFQAVSIRPSGFQSFPLVPDPRKGYKWSPSDITRFREFAAQYGAHVLSELPVLAAQYYDALKQNGREEMNKHARWFQAGGLPESVVCLFKQGEADLMLKPLTDLQQDSKGQRMYSPPLSASDALLFKNSLEFRSDIGPIKKTLERVVPVEPDDPRWKDALPVSVLGNDMCLLVSYICRTTPPGRQTMFSPVGEHLKLVLCVAVLKVLAHHTELAQFAHTFIGSITEQKFRALLLRPESFNAGWIKYVYDAIQNANPVAFNLISRLYHIIKIWSLLNSSITVKYVLKARTVAELIVLIKGVPCYWDFAIFQWMPANLFVTITDITRLEAIITELIANGFAASSVFLRVTFATHGKVHISTYALNMYREVDAKGNPTGKLDVFLREPVTTHAPLTTPSMPAAEKYALYAAMFHPSEKVAPVWIPYEEFCICNPEVAKCSTCEVIFTILDRRTSQPPRCVTCRVKNKEEGDRAPETLSDVFATCQISCEAGHKFTHFPLDQKNMQMSSDSCAFCNKVCPDTEIEKKIQVSAIFTENENQLSSLVSIPPSFVRKILSQKPYNSCVVEVDGKKKLSQEFLEFLDSPFRTDPPPQTEPFTCDGYALVPASNQAALERINSLGYICCSVCDEDKPCAQFKKICFNPHCIARVCTVDDKDSDGNSRSSCLRQSYASLCDNDGGKKITSTHLLCIHCRTPIDKRLGPLWVLRYIKTLPGVLMSAEAAGRTVWRCAAGPECKAVKANRWNEYLVVVGASRCGEDDNAPPHCNMCEAASFAEREQKLREFREEEHRQMMIRRADQEERERKEKEEGYRKELEQTCVADDGANDTCGFRIGRITGEDKTEIEVKLRQCPHCIVDVGKATAHWFSKQRADVLDRKQTEHCCHMTCTLCRMEHHWCWCCGKGFESGDATAEHLTLVYGHMFPTDAEILEKHNEAYERGMSFDAFVQHLEEEQARLLAANDHEHMLAVSDHDSDNDGSDNDMW